MGSTLENFGDNVLAALRWMGGAARLLLLALQRGPRRPFGIADITYQMVVHGVRSIPLTAFMALFLGMVLAWQFGWALQAFGAKMAIGNASSLALVREIIPTTLALTVGAKMAAGMAAELGSMKVTEQIDAIAALGADPIKKLVWPRVVAATLGLPLLVVWGNVVGLFGGMLIADVVFGVPTGYFYESYVEELAPIDYVSSVVKATVFGTIVGLTGCYQGFETKFGTEAVGLATTQTIVITSITILLADFLLTMFFLPI